MSSSAQRTLPFFGQPMRRYLTILFAQRNYWSPEKCRVIWLEHWKHQSFNSVSLLSSWPGSFKTLLLLFLVLLTVISRSPRGRKKPSAILEENHSNCIKTTSIVEILCIIEKNKMNCSSRGKILLVDDYCIEIGKGQQVSLAFRMVDGKLDIKPTTKQLSVLGFGGGHNSGFICCLHFRLGLKCAERRIVESWLGCLSFDPSYWSRTTATQTLANKIPMDGNCNNDWKGNDHRSRQKDDDNRPSRTSCGNNIKCLSRNRTLLMAIVVRAQFLTTAAFQLLVLVKIIKIISIPRRRLPATVVQFVIVVIVMVAMVMHQQFSNFFEMLGTTSHRLKSKLRTTMMLMMFSPKFRAFLIVRRIIMVMWH